MNETGFRAALVVDTDQKLLGIVTDGDVRKALLRGVSLDAQLPEVMNATPLVAPAGLPDSDYLGLMMQNRNECLPVVDEAHRVVNLVFLRDFIEKKNLESSMVIMAGGQGKRLWPLTKDTPKPLLPVADRPLLDHILTRAKAQGFQDIWVSTHYKSERIEAFLDEFLDSAAPKDLNINVIKEETPQGTAGCLKNFHNTNSDKPLFIMNGDILTTLDFQAMLEWHYSHGNLLTIACRQYAFTVPYGVLETDGQRLLSCVEKPEKCYNINAGIYLLEPEALNYIPDNIHFDMTDLVDVLLAAHEPVGTFPISEAWIDIGKHEDYEHVNRESHRYLSTGASL